MEELLSLKWNNHNSSFIEVLSNLRSKPLYTDVTLACEGNLYNVHKFVLSTCSDYFRNIFESIQCKEPVIILMDIKCNELEALLDYMYLGEMNVSQMDLDPLIKTAECLQLKGLAVLSEKKDKRKSESTHFNKEKKKLKVTDHSPVESPYAEPISETFDCNFIEKANPNEVFIKEEETESEIIDNKDEMDTFNIECDENIGPESPVEPDPPSDIWKDLPPGQENDMLSSFTMTMDEYMEMPPGNSQQNMSSLKLKNCNICYKSFRKASDLLRHLRTHTGERPFGCPYCDYWATGKPSVSRHMMRKHNDHTKANIKTKDSYNDYKLHL